MAPSEFGSYKWRVDLKALVKTDPDKKKCSEDTILTKVDTKEMIQVSVHDQVKMNIDIIFRYLKEMGIYFETIDKKIKECYSFERTTI